MAKCLEKKEFGGLDLDKSGEVAGTNREEVSFLIEAWLETCNSQEKARKLPMQLSVKSEKTRPMTLAERIFAHHVIGGAPMEGLKTGELARVAVDWVIASEAWDDYCWIRLPYLLHGCNGRLGHRTGNGGRGHSCGNRLDVVQDPRVDSHLFHRQTRV